MPKQSLKLYITLIFLHMENNTQTLRKRILPILLFCEANKGDLSLYRTWDSSEERKKKLFYAYYAGLFCRILYRIEYQPVSSEGFISDCDSLLDKYNWYNIQEKDLKLFHSEDPYYCEVPEAFEFLDDIDNVIWNSTDSGHRRDAICFKSEHVIWTFADVRGSR